MITDLLLQSLKEADRPKSTEPDQNKLYYELLQSILDASIDEIFVVDKNGYILFVNKIAKEHYGIEATDLVGKTVFHFGKQGLWEPTIFPIVMKEKKKIAMLQNTALGKTLLVTANPIFDQNKEIIMVVENARDLTEIELLRKSLNKEQNKVLQYKSQLEMLRKKELDISGFVVHSESMVDIVNLSRQVAATDATVLILGETGVGKTLLAKLIHNLSARVDEPFITLNCAAIPDQLFESELFGYSPGAFTGASTKGKTGLIELADGGTLFLDEIGDISPQLQAKLLQVIEERQFYKIGGKTPKNIDIRILTATNRDLKTYVKDGTFREDLYYRLNVVEITIPPLRERTEEIVRLADHFLDLHNKKYDTNKRLSDKVQDLLLAYPWPGNVRELSHVIERLIITNPGNLIKPQSLSRLTNLVMEDGSNSSDDEAISVNRLVPLDHALETVEKHLVTTAYVRLRSSYKVAEVLGVSQSKAYRLMRKYQCFDIK